VKSPLRWVLFGLAVAQVVAVGAFAWHVSWQTAHIPDVAQPADLVMTARYGDGWPMSSVNGLSLRVTGEIDGEAEVWTADGSPRLVSGRVDLLVGHDWFQPTCHLHYRPKGVTKGKLIVRYQFH
jgi:hypothetical protein